MTSADSRRRVLFIVAALTILAPEIPALRRLVEALRSRYPAVYQEGC
jgi:hypothetical protein